MRIVPLLMFWALPFFPAAQHGEASRHSLINGLSGDRFITLFVVHASRDDSWPGDPSEGNLGQSPSEEDDSLEDALADSGLSASWEVPRTSGAERFAWHRSTLSVSRSLC